MRRNIYGKMISIVMAMALCVTSVNVSAVQSESEITKKNALMSDKQEIFENDDKSIDDEGREKPVVIKEIKSMRDENSNTYLMSNGMKKTVYYSDNIRFEEDGKLKKYNSELVAAESQDKKIISLAKNISVKNSKKYKYVNKSGDTKQYLPETIGEESPVLLTQDDYRISFVPLDAGENSDDYVETKTDKVSLETEKIEDAVTGKKEEKSIKAVYENTGNDTKIAYHSLEHGIKEDIILNEIPDNNEFLYKICTENLEVRLDAVGGGISFIDKEKDSIVAGIPAPSMNDSTGKAYSEDVHYELEKSVSETKGVNAYILKIVADNDYLTSTDRKYPVTIDPSVTWEGTGELGEAYILKANPDVNYYASGVKAFSVGKGSQGLFRTYMRALDLKSTVSGKYVESAKLILYENGANTKGVKINVEPVKNEFACRNITWNNQPGGTGDSLATFTSSGTADAKKTLNMTTWARNVAKGSGSGNKNYGLVFKAENESASSYVKFYGSRTASTSKMPKMEVVYYDGPTKPENVSLTKVHIKSGEKLQVSWSGITSKALDYVQYKVKNYDESTHSATTDYVAYSDSTKLGTTSSGTKTIDASSGWKEGHYYLYVRGVDKGGIKSPEKAIGFVIDRTAPVLNSVTITPSTSASSYSNKLPKITWNVTEKNLLSIQVKVNNGNYTALAGTNTGNATISDLESEKINTISVRAIDRAGNVSAEKKFTYYYDDDAPEIDMKVIPDTDEDKYDNSPDMPQLEYSINDGTLKDYRLTVNGKSQTLLENKGTVTIENIEEGENSIAISATDKAGNDTEEECLYYRDITNPTKGTVKITPKTGFFNSSNQIPVVKWNGFCDDNLSEIQIKINDGEYKTLGLNAGGEGQLSATDFPKDGKYTLTVRGIDKAGNISEEVSNNYYYETADYELDGYTPVNVYAIEQIGGNTILRFSTKNGKFRDDVKYQVYRSTTPNVVINENTFVKSYSSKGSINVSGDEGVTYYYKLRTVKKTNDVMQYSDYSEEISSTTIGLDEKDNRLGINSMYQYSSISTPNGTGKVELSRGNFIYSQQDIYLPAPQLPININRTYNAKSSEISSMGYGWRQAYDMYVSIEGDKVYYVDGTNALYTFDKKDEKYICNENADISLEIDDDRLNRNIEKDNKIIKKLELDVYYKITTKDGDVYRFDDGGRLVLMEESNETFVYVDYNSKNGRIESVSTSKGQVAKYSYNEDGLISRITVVPENKNSYSYEYQYDNSKLTKATFVGTNDGKIEYKYIYNNENRLSNIIDAMGNKYSIEYNGEYMSKFSYPNGEYTTFNFTKNQKQSQPLTKIKGYSQGCEVSSEEYKFTLDGRITYKKDSLGNSLSYSYDRNTKSLLTDTTDIESYYTLDNDTVVQKQISDNDKTEYDSNGNITKSIDADGTITENTYDYSSDSIDTVKNQPTNTKVTDPNGNTTENTTYKYDKLGNIIEEIDSIKNIKTVYTYGEDGEVSSSQEYIGENIKDKDFEHTAILSYDEDTSYNEDGDEVKEDSSEGTVEEKIFNIYNDYGNVILNISSKEEISEELIEKLKADNSIDNIKSIVKGTDLVINKNTYDEFLRTIKTTEISKKGTKITENKYDNNGNVVESVDEKNRVTKTTFDSMNRAIKTELIVDNDSKTTKTSYSYGSINRYNGRELELLENLNVVTVTDTQGEVVGKTYTDAYGRTVREMSNGLYCDYTYDNNGKVFTTYVSGVNETNPDLAEDGKLTVSTYDKRGNLTATIINPEIDGSLIKVGDNSIVTKNSYDNAGNQLSSTDALGNVTSYEYDDQGRLSKVMESGEVKGTYNYDKFNEVDGKYDSIEESITYANEAKAITTINGSDQVLSISDESSDGNLKTSYEYDKDGEKIKEIYNDGSYVKFEYDIDGNQTRKMSYTFKNELEGASEFIYNDENQLIKIVDKHSDNPYRYTFYEYDKYGRNISVAEINAKSEPSDDTIEKAKLKYVYNIDDNIEKIYYPNNGADKLKGIKFNYNKDKWITSIDGLLSGDESTKIREYVYHNDGKVKTIKDYKNFLDKKSEYIAREYRYDMFDRVVSMEYSNSEDLDNILESYSYRYDKNSYITYKGEVFNYPNNKKDEEITYSYNKSSQLIKSKKVDNLNFKTTTSAYDYDKVGNRVYDAETVKYTVADEGEILEGTYHYNDYNKLNQLIKTSEVCAKSVANNSSSKTYVNTYKYDDRGNKIEEVDGKNGDTTIYSYDVENQLVDVKVNKKLIQHNEYNSAGQRIKKVETISSEFGEKTETTNYYYEGSLLLYSTNEKGEKISQNVIGNASNSFATIRYKEGQSEYFYSKDIQGSITNITDRNGNCVNSYDYTDFGETSERLDSTIDNEICYTGGVYDKTIQLYYLNSRYYNPEDGAFMSQDTHRGTDVGSWNLYGYCEGNPVNYVDPSGYSAVVVSGGCYKKEKKDNGKYYYEFIETALLQLKDWSKYKMKKYWLIAKKGWTKSDRKTFKKLANEYKNVKVKFFKSGKKLISKLNGKKFKNDPITDFTVFAHGCPGKIAFGFDYTKNIYDHDEYDLTYSQISKIKKSSFCYPRTYFYSCNAATKGDNGKKFAKKWSKRFWSTTTAFKGKTDYSGIRDNSIFQKIFGRDLGPADLYPVADKDAKKIRYIKAVISAPQ